MTEQQRTTFAINYINSLLDENKPSQALQVIEHELFIVVQKDITSIYIAQLTQLAGCSKLDLGLYEEAIEYFTLTSSYAKEQNNIEMRVNALLNISNTYSIQNKHLKGLNLLEEVIDLSEKLVSKELYMRLCLNAANSAVIIGNYTYVMELLERSKRYGDFSDYPDFEQSEQTVLSRMYIGTQNRSISIKYRYYDIGISLHHGLYTQFLTGILKILVMDDLLTLERRLQLANFTTAILDKLPSSLVPNNVDVIPLIFALSYYLEKKFVMMKYYLDLLSTKFLTSYCNNPLYKHYYWIFLTSYFLEVGDKENSVRTFSMVIESYQEIDSENISTELYAAEISILLEDFSSAKNHLKTAEKLLVHNNNYVDELELQKTLIKYYTAVSDYKKAFEISKRCKDLYSLISTTEQIQDYVLSRNILYSTITEKAKKMIVLHGDRPKEIQTNHQHIYTSIYKNLVHLVKVNPEDFSNKLKDTIGLVDALKLNTSIPFEVTLNKYYPYLYPKE